MGYYWFLELLIADDIMVSIDAEADVEKFCVFSHYTVACLSPALDEAVRLSMEEMALCSIMKVSLVWMCLHV